MDNFSEKRTCFLRTYTRCGFSSHLSPGMSPTWAPARFLIGLSVMFLIDLSFSSATG